MGKDKKDKPEDRQEYIKAKKRKYGENWKDHVSFGDPGKWKEKPKPESDVRSGMRRFNRGGKV